jgi:hypothetical protein
MRRQKKRGAASQPAPFFFIPRSHAQVPGIARVEKLQQVQSEGLIESQAEAKGIWNTA